jgi:endonuclease YncB( thermonuclease family)
VATEAIPGHGRGVVATVLSVVDGDTVELELGGQRERVRLLGIDTPETVHPSKPVECWGPEASALATQLLAPGTEVLVQRDQEARDRFGRLLAYLWRRHDHLFVNGVLCGRGRSSHVVDRTQRCPPGRPGGSGAPSPLRRTWPVGSLPHRGHPGVACHR